MPNIDVIGDIRATGYILLGLSYILLGLGIFSGVCLFFRAIFGENRDGPVTATRILWGLFIIGVLAGIIVLAAAKL